MAGCTTVTPSGFGLPPNEQLKLDPADRSGFGDANRVLAGKRHYRGSGENGNATQLSRPVPAVRPMLSGAWSLKFDWRLGFFWCTAQSHKSPDLYRPRVCYIPAHGYSCY